MEWWILTSEYFSFVRESDCANGAREWTLHDVSRTHRAKVSIQAMQQNLNVKSPNFPILWLFWSQYHMSQKSCSTGSCLWWCEECNEATSQKPGSQQHERPHSKQGYIHPSTPSGVKRMKIQQCSPTMDGSPLADSFWIRNSVRLALKFWV